MPASRLKDNVAAKSARKIKPCLRFLKDIEQLNAPRPNARRAQKTALPKQLAQKEQSNLQESKTKQKKQGQDKNREPTEAKPPARIQSRGYKSGQLPQYQKIAAKRSSFTEAS